MKKNTHSKPKQALFWDLSGAFVKQFSSFFISIILARLLGPEEFGVIAMSMVFISISQVFTDVGFASGLVQQKDTKDVTYSSVFYINLGISIAVSFIIILIAPYIAQFYEEPRVISILYILAIIPPISALGKVQIAILTKNLNFKSLTIRDIVATICGGTIGIVAAFSDFGVYSLVIQQITIVIVGTMMLWRATKWKPKLEYSKSEIKKLFKFSSYIFLDDLIRRVFLNIDKVFIAKAFSPAILGFYTRAESLKSQVDSYTTQSLSKVIFPIFSQIQDNEKRFKSTYHRAFNTISGIMVLIVAPLYFLADVIIINLLGEQWQRSVFFFEILVLTTLVSPHMSIMANAILGKGYSKFKLKIGFIQRFLMFFPISIGYFYGISEFTLAIVFTYYVIFFVYLIAVHKKLNINFWAQLKNIIIPNLLFIVLMLLDFIVGINLNRWLIAVLFIALHLVFLKAMKHESYSFIYHNVIHLKNNIFKK